MTNPLEYESAPSPALARKRQAAWIAVLISGILATLAGIGLTILVVSVAIFDWRLHARPAMGHVRLAPIPWWLFMIAASIALIPLALGITSIVCSIRIKLGSRSAGVTALNMARAQFFLLGGVAFIIINLVNASGAVRGLNIGAVFLAIFLAVGAILQAILERLLQRLLREKQPDLPES